MVLNKDKIWNEHLKKFTTQHALKNKWRVLPYMDAEDLVQDGYFIFSQIVKRYDHINNDSDIKKIYAKTFVNYIHQLSLVKTKEDTFSETLRIIQDSFITDYHLQAPIILEETPEELKEIVRTLASGRKQRRNRSFLSGLFDKETMNEFFCRITKKDHKKEDLNAAMKKYFEV